MLLKMARVQIIGSRAQLDATIAALHRLGVLHIEEATAPSLLKGLASNETSVRLQENLAFLAARLDALIHLLPASEDRVGEQAEKLPAASQELAEWVRRQLDHIAPPIQELARRRDELQAEALSLPRYETTLKTFAPLAAELQTLQRFDTVALLIDRRYRDVLDLIRLELDRLRRGQCEIIARDVDDRTTAALLVCPRPASEEVQAILAQESVTQVRLPKELAGRTLRDALAGLEELQSSLQEDLQRTDVELEKSGRQWHAPLVAWRREVKNHLQELATRARFGATTYTFVVEGWVPQRELSRLRETLAREIGDQVMVNQLKITRVQQVHAPVALTNPAPLKPFEMLVRMMALPRYGALDPTPLVAVFVPLFFGMILGDIGHGALLLGLSLYLNRRFGANTTVRDVAHILMYGSLWAILFGFLYGEFFGTLGSNLGLRPLWMPRGGEQILALFAFSLGLGVVQVVLGLLLGVWETWRERQGHETVAKVGMLVVLAAIFGMVGVATDLLPRDFFTPTAVAFLLGLVLLILPAGPLGLLLGPLQVLETVGNILSYLRLAAVGLSAVYLNVVANELAGLVGNLVVGVILAFLLHGLNFALGIVSPTIQSLRLQYVEFFRQFYRGGGEEYRPFKMD